MAVAGCSQAGRPAGSFTIAQQWEPRSLNPALENGTSSSEWGLLVFSYLVKYDDRGQLIPDVATVVPTLRQRRNQPRRPRRSPITFAKGFVLPTVSH